MTTGALVSHLKVCNPDQLSELPEKRSDKRKRLAREAGDGTCVNKKGGSYGLNFSCSYCARKFAFKKALDKHEILHEIDPDNKKLKHREVSKCK